MARLSVPAGSLERVRERVTEVEDRPAAPLGRVGEADRGLERGAAADELLVGEAPQLPVGEQPGLDDLGHPLGALPRGQRREQVRVGHDPRGRVEGADEVLPLVEVDAGLAADRRVDLPDERRRDGHPGDAAQKRGGDEAGDVGRGAAAERDDRAGAVERELGPEPLADARVLAASPDGTACVAVSRCAERGPVEVEHALVGDELDGAVARHVLVETRERARARRRSPPAASSTPSTSRATASAASR